MKLTFNKSEIPFKWESVSIAHWLKYPNDNNPFVRNVDLLDRRTDSATPDVLNSTRFITLAGAPAIVRRFIPQSNSMFNCEQSTVNRKTKTLTLQTFNITLLNILSVFEETVYTVHPENPNHTIMEQQYRISVPLFGQSIIESYLAKTCLDNAQKGISHLQNLCRELEEKFDRQFDSSSQVDFGSLSSPSNSDQYTMSSPSNSDQYTIANSPSSFLYEPSSAPPKCLPYPSSEMMSLSNKEQTTLFCT